MNANETIASLLRDAKHIAKANKLTVLAYLIGMALEHIQDDIRPQKAKAG